MGWLNLAGFDSGDFSESYDGNGYGAGITVSSSSPITGTHSIRAVPAGALCFTYLGRQSDGASAEFNTANVYSHFTLRWDTLLGGSAAIWLVYGLAAGGTPLLAYINATSGGVLQVVYVDGSNVGQVASGSFSCSTGQVYDIEFAVLNAATAGAASVVMRVDGVEVVNASGLTLTSAVGNVGIAAAGVVANTTGDVRFDDIAFRDDGWCGPLRVTSLTPNGAGNYAAWAGGTGSTDAEVDDATSDGDTTYIKSSTSGDKSSFATTDLAGAPTVKAVKALLHARDEGGSSAIAPMFRYSSTDAIGSYTDPGSAYVTRGYIRATDPSGNAWTATSVNGAEVGVASNASVAARVTRMALLVAEEYLVPKADSENAAANVTESEAVETIDEKADSENAGGNVTEAEAVDLVAPVDAENLAANVTESDAIAATVDDAENAAANVTEAEAAVVVLDPDADSLAENVTEAEAVAVTGDFPRRRIRIDVYTAAGAKVDAGPITDVLAFDYALELDRIGSFSCDLPATSRQGDSIAQGYELRFHREGEGLVFRGIVERVTTVVGSSGQLVRRVSGPSIARELARLSTLLGRSFSGATLAVAVGDNATSGSLLHGTGWAPGSLASPATTLLARFDGPNRWEALAKVAEIFRVHVREDNLNREVDLEAEEESEDLVTTVIPLGTGEGLNQLDLRYSNRATPYAISNATGPDGRTYYYLEDASAVSSYGRRERVLSVKDAIPLANSAAGFQAAANALYDVAATFLSRASSPLVSYRVAVTGLRHLGTSGTPLVALGQTVRVVYRGIVSEESTGARAWRSIDANLYVMGFRRSFDDAGGDAWQLTVNSIDRYQDDPASRITEAFQSMHALQVSLRNYTYHEVHILNRTSIESGKNATLTVKWDANISLVHQAKLTFKVQSLRSNVSVAASGGGSTSSGGTSHTHSVSGTTSSGGTSHTNSVSGQSASQSGDTLE